MAFSCYELVSLIYIYIYASSFSYTGLTDVRHIATIIECDFPNVVRMFWSVSSSTSLVVVAWSPHAERKWCAMCLVMI